VVAHDPPEVLKRFEENLELAEIVARQMGRAAGRHASFDELVSFGRSGLLEAARRFDPARGVPFRVYANFRVKGAILDGLRSMSALPRRAHERLRGLEALTLYGEGAAEDVFAAQPPAADRVHAEQALVDHLGAMATAMAMGFISETGWGEDGAPVSIVPGDSPEESAARSELLAAVRDEIDRLPYKEAELVRRHYLEGERFDHVARDLGLSKSWASRLHTRAMGRLHKRLSGRVDS
jgi:RNA polymerase sigma factor for flagellar operon FliA